MSLTLRSTARPLAAITTIGMFIVIVMGATVTNTGSAQGCGRSWPLCNGQFIPEFAVATLIEFSHRLVTGIEGILVMALAAVTMMFWRHFREVQVLVPLMVLTLILQAGMGAWAVLYPQQPLVMALHFGISLLCFSSTALIATFIFQSDFQEGLRAVRVPVNLRRTIWGTAAFTLVAVYIGAYVRHTNAQLACIDWPLCNGSLFPGFSGPVGIVFTHRITALVIVIAIGFIFAWTRTLRDQRPDLYWGSMAALVTVLLQAATGAIVVFTRLDLFSALSHAGVMALLFGALTYLCLHALPPFGTVRKHIDPTVTRSRQPVGSV